MVPKDFNYIIYSSWVLPQSPTSRRQAWRRALFESLPVEVWLYTFNCLPVPSQWNLAEMLGRRRNENKIGETGAETSRDKHCSGSEWMIGPGQHPVSQGIAVASYTHLGKLWSNLTTRAVTRITSSVCVSANPCPNAMSVVVQAQAWQTRSQ